VSTSMALEGLSIEELTGLTEEGISHLSHLHCLKRLRSSSPLFPQNLTFDLYPPITELGTQGVSAMLHWQQLHKGARNCSHSISPTATAHSSQQLGSKPRLSASSIWKHSPCEGPRWLGTTYG